MQHVSGVPPFAVFAECVLYNSAMVKVAELKSSQPQ